MTPPVLEVIACSVADAIEAEKGGADRLEVVRDLALGGLTPTWELVREIKAVVDLPLRVMLRESVGFQTSGEDEIRKLCRAAERIASLGIDGFVIGFLRHQQVDVDLTQQVLACAPKVKATFHHAFEDAKDKILALNEINRLPQVDRVLSNGGTDEIAHRIQRLDEYQRAAKVLTVIAGGDIDGDAILKIGRETGIREFHVGRAARANSLVEGDVQASLVSSLVKTLREL